MRETLYRLLLAASLMVSASGLAHAQGVGPSRGLHDSITVTTVKFVGAKNVSSDDLKRVVFTRPSPCRLPFLIPVCNVTRSQVVVDRRRTTSAALGADITALRVYYWQRGYREAQVDTVVTPEKRGSAVEFRIVEGEPIRISTLHVTQRVVVLDSAELNEAVTLTQGEPLSLLALDTTLTRLRAAVWNKGYGDVRIDTSVPRPDASHLVPVRIDIDPRWVTRVGSVEFEGNHYLATSVLRRGLVLQPGSLYTRNAVLESQLRLFQSPAIARAVVITPAAGDSLKTLTIAVAETPPHHVSLTAGFNTIEYGEAAAEVRLNDLGAGRWLSVRASAGNLLGNQLSGHGIFRAALPSEVTGDPQGFLSPTYQATATLTLPWIAGARTSAALTAFAGRRSVPNVVIDDDAGASIGLVHELSMRFPVGLNYRMETTRVQGTAVYFCADYGICDASTRSALMKRQRLAPVGVSAWIDRSDELEVPTKGYTAVIDAEHASSLTGSTFAHNRISADASLYHAFGATKVVADVEQPRKVLAFHARAGYVRPLGILHPRARFYAGGMQSVRGFAENELGPTMVQARRASLLAVGCTDATISSGACDASAVPNSELFSRPIGGSSVIEGSAELRIPLLKALGAVVFLDGAYVGTSGISSISHGKGAITPGGGFRYNSPLGILRLDIGLRPVGAEMLPVVVAVTDPSGDDRIVRLANEKSYSPIDPSTGTLHSIARRLVVHFAMGQAF
ncbi:MAG: BamA/TamA family outer membrane protein [Gemmatimonadota bacterium]|nr:BamA/TamA family outer membrane protein [Gemmatimonadota bacterium]